MENDEKVKTDLFIKLFFIVGKQVMMWVINVKICFIIRYKCGNNVDKNICCCFTRK